MLGPSSIRICVSKFVSSLRAQGKLDFLVLKEFSGMRIDIPDDKKLVHEAIIPLRWGDMDAFGHINNTLYFRYMEQGRIHWIESFGFGIQHPKAEP